MGIAAEDAGGRVASKLDAPFSARRLSGPADQERQRRVGMAAERRTISGRSEARCFSPAAVPAYQ
jgi:hypothetical protein